MPLFLVIILCIGPISCIFDIMTYMIMWNIFDANTPETQSLFQTGWFLVGLLIQTLIVHMNCTQDVPFIQSTAGKPVLILIGIVIVLGNLSSFF